MERLTVQLGARSYPILIGPGLLADGGLLASHVGASDLLLVSDETVAPLWAPRLRAALAGARVVECILPDGEAHKGLAAWSRVIDALAEARMSRDCMVLALGGGVIGDVAGFAAACWQRGVDFIQLPTTLLAQVDSAVGGKTAINHAAGKNLIGAFHQPRAVLADTDTLATLPARQLRAGLAEVIKCGLIRDAGLFAWLEDNVEAVIDRDPQALVFAIRSACECKAAIVSADEYERGDRALLNLGHTFAHAIETASGYGTWLHGEAVAMGLDLAAQLSARLGWLGLPEAARIRALLVRAGLPVEPPRMGAARALELMGMDKKVREGRIRLVLLKRIGFAVCTNEYPSAALQAALEDRFGETGR